MELDVQAAGGRTADSSLVTRPGERDGLWVEDITDDGTSGTEWDGNNIEQKLQNRRDTGETRDGMVVRFNFKWRNSSAQSQGSSHARPWSGLSHIDHHPRFGTPVTCHAFIMVHGLLTPFMHYSWSLLRIHFTRDRDYLLP